MTSSNKLVDKYQYNETQIRTQGLAEIITAKHIVLKQWYTLKKINISNPQTIAKYHGVINQMNILKALRGSLYVFKCHKMLKTSNNLYVVYDHMGKSHTLAQLLQNDLSIARQKKKFIAVQILNFLKEMRQQSILHLGINPKIIQVNERDEIKFLNLQCCIFSKKNASSSLFSNIQTTDYSAPQLKQFMQNCSFPRESYIDFSLFSERLDKAGVYSFGKILQNIFKQQIHSFVQAKDNLEVQNFQTDIRKIVQAMVLQNFDQRPKLQEIQNFLTEKGSDSKRPKIKISRLNSNLSVSNLGASSKSVSRLDKNLSRQLLSPHMNDDFDRKSIKSIKSSSNLRELSPSANLRKRKIQFSNTQSQVQKEQMYAKFTLKIIKRRNLCKFLFKISNMVFSLQLMDQTERVIISFMLIKKGVLLICSLARYLQTGKGAPEEFDFNETSRKQFFKTEDFSKLSLTINKEMDLARILYLQCIDEINQEFPQIREARQFNFASQCKSQVLNEKLMKQKIIKLITQVLRKIQTPNKENLRKKTSENNLTSSSRYQDSFLTTSIRSIKQNKFLQVDDINMLVRSARTIKSNISGSGSSLGDVTMKSFQSGKIMRNLSSETLMYLYLMGSILDFESYEKMFHNLIVDERLELKDQCEVKKLKNMQIEQLAYRLHQLIQ